MTAQCASYPARAVVSLHHGPAEQPEVGRNRPSVVAKLVLPASTRTTRSTSSGLYQVNDQLSGRLDNVRYHVLQSSIEPGLNCGELRKFTN